MCSLWIPVRERDRYGIVIQSFSAPGPHRLELTLGESVHILSENGDWFYGYATANPSSQGIFPKSYVKIMESIIDRSGPSDVVRLKQSPVVQELTSVIREWGAIWKQLYISNSSNFQKIRSKLLDLMFYRNKIIPGTLPVDELKQVKRLVAAKIDVGNKLLDLDMVVRDDQGNILDPMRTSTIQLYFHHQRANDRIDKATAEPVGREDKKPVIQQYCHILYVSLKGFTSKIMEDAELLLSLYDAKEGKPFTENFVVPWPKQTPDRTVHNVLFTDLGARDLVREKVYLLCYIVRIGGMDKSNGVKLQSDFLARRPFGVAAMDITLYINGKLDPDEDKHHFLPLLQCDKDNLEGTLKRILTLKEITQKDHKGQGISASFKMLHGDLKQVREENPHLVLGQVSVARKMGFPEVILPGDVRNDLYLTLVSGDFSKGSKITDKNIQVTVTVCNEKGEALPAVIKAGGGVQDENEYRSVVYYREDKPRWSETCKVTVPIEDFKGSHLKFIFSHRSSNEAKDKNKSEKPFSLSYVRLMQDNGTTLPDAQHDLLVYKFDHKKFDAQDVSYLSLPSSRQELEDGSKPYTNTLTLSNKDSFLIQTNVCSTKLTQNVDLLGLLNWHGQSEPVVLQSLEALMNVSGEEIVKFLQDVLDALFNILTDKPSSKIYDAVFNCLLYIIGLVSDRKYQHFQPVLDLYIKESFCATLVFSNLLAVLNKHVADGEKADCQELLKVMKSLQYIIRFIVTSRKLFAEINDGGGQEEFVTSMEDLLHSIADLMRHEKDEFLVVQGACLKYFPTAIADISSVFDPVQLCVHVGKIINQLPPKRLTKQKMMTLHDVVHSQLFLKPECREKLLPVILINIKNLIESTDEVELCINILSDIMDLLYQDDTLTTPEDISEIMFTILRTVIQRSIFERSSYLMGNIVALVLSILRQMSMRNFDEYIEHFKTQTDRQDFLIEIILVFKDLVMKPVYPKDWYEMIMLQNSIILKSLRAFSHTIRDYFFVSFDYKIWSHFFHCAIAFLTQPALQLETFSTNKKWRVISRYKDMRRETGFEIRSMWFNLEKHKMNFIPSIIGPFLKMSLIPDTEFRRATIPIFFDMMQCEFYAPKGKIYDKRDTSNSRANFREFENEMIAKLDNLVEAGMGDVQYKELFFEIMMGQCENHITMKDQGVRFVKTVSRLMERLLEYRCIINDESNENRMSCTVNLLDFYSEINRQEMYIRYVNKLCDLHLECDNFTEAAYTLKLHAKLLKWSDANLPLMLQSPKYDKAMTHRELKEGLYKEIIIYFNKGKMWECAIEVCKELVEQCEETDLHEMSELLKEMAEFYQKILTCLRPEPEYFRVAYYGKGFPGFLQNKVFVYRGKEYERLSDFCTRTLNQLPNAELMNTLTPPTEEIMNSPGQYVQINKVEPIMGERRPKANGRQVCDQLLKYYRVNNVQKFSFSRPYHRRDSTTTEDNEFSSLWVERNILVTSYPLPGILRWFPVTSVTINQLSPLLNAIETMKMSNNSLRELILAHKRDPKHPLNPLSMKLHGIVDAAVMGGIKKYESAFFTLEYSERNQDQTGKIDLLKDLIAEQIPLLEIGIHIHDNLASDDLRPFHDRLNACFQDLKKHVVNSYGCKSCDIDIESMFLRRGMRESSDGNRFSGASMGSTEGNRSTSTVSSLTSQVASLKTLVHFGSLSPSATLSRASSMNLRSSRSSYTRGSPSLSLPGSATVSRKEKKKKRRNTNWENGGLLEDSRKTQWYTSDLIQDVFELNQQLTPSRPLRSEVEKEKRLSRPPSTQFVTRQLSSSNRDSIGTTDSTASEEDPVPPPLPVKLREADYCNLPVGNPLVTYAPYTPAKVKAKPVPPEPTVEGICIVETSSHPPTPPPKRPFSKFSIS